MRSRSRIGAAVAGAVLLVVNGCLGSFEEPVVRLDGVRLGSVGLAGGLLYAQLSISNPNDFGFETQSLTYDLEIARPDGDAETSWVRLADGRFDLPIVLGARDSTRIEVPVEFTFGSLTGIAGAFLDRGTVDYRVSGMVDVNEPISRTVPYERQGTVSFDAIR